MKNYEFYKEQIEKAIRDGVENIAVINGEIQECDKMFEAELCEKCIFKHQECCDATFYTWLMAEYEEPRKELTLTKKERLLCEALESGWMARDRYSETPHMTVIPKCGPLYFYRDKPKRGFRGENWGIASLNGVARIAEPLGTFDFITADDEEPWSIEELLKLEVK